MNLNFLSIYYEPGTMLGMGECDVEKSRPGPRLYLIEEAETNSSNKSKQIHETIRYVLYWKHSIQTEKSDDGKDILMELWGHEKTLSKQVPHLCGTWRNWSYGNRRVFWEERAACVKAKTWAQTSLIWETEPLWVKHSELTVTRVQDCLLGVRVRTQVLWGQGRGVRGVDDARPWRSV